MAVRAPIDALAGVSGLSCEMGASLRQGTGTRGTQPGHMDLIIGFNYRVESNAYRNSGVPFKGACETITALISGEITMTINGMAVILPYVPTDQLRALPISTVRRSPLAPDLPTMQEAGIAGYSSQPQVAYDAWNVAAVSLGAPGIHRNEMRVENVAVIQPPFEFVPGGLVNFETSVSSAAPDHSQIEMFRREKLQLLAIVPGRA
jgi:hypothetical protein